MVLKVDEITNQLQSIQNNTKLSFNSYTKKITHLYQDLLDTTLDEKNIVDIEQLKSKLITSFNKKINLETNLLRNNKTIPWYKKYLSYGFSMIGTFLAGVSGYTAARSLLLAFTQFSNPVSLALGISIGIIEAVVFIGIDVIKSRSVNISPFVKPSLTEYPKQLEKMQVIEQQLLTSRLYRKSYSSDYLSAQAFLSVIQKDFKQKAGEMDKIYKENLPKKITQTFFSGVGAILCTASGILAGKSFLAVFGAAALSSTPLGWAVGVGLGLFSLTVFVYQRKKTICKMVDELMGFPKGFKNAHEKFQGYQPKFNSYLNEIVLDKKNDETKEKATNDRVLALEQAMEEMQLRFPINPQCEEAKKDNISLLSLQPILQRKRKQPDSLFSSTQKMRKRLHFEGKRTSNNDSGLIKIQATYK